MSGNVQDGKQIVWKASGGDYAMTFAPASAGIASTKARAGAKGDLGNFRAPKYAFTAEIEMDVEPVAGTTIEFYWAASHDNGTTFPAGITGLDGAWQSSSETEFKKQLQFIGALVLTADVQPVVQIQTFVFSPPTRWGCPVLINLGGQALEGNDDVHTLTLTPIPQP